MPASTSDRELATRPVRPERWRRRHARRDGGRDVDIRDTRPGSDRSNPTRPVGWRSRRTARESDRPNAKLTENKYVRPRVLRRPRGRGRTTPLTGENDVQAMRLGTPHPTTDRDVDGGDSRTNAEQSHRRPGADAAERLQCSGSDVKSSPAGRGDRTRRVTTERVGRIHPGRWGSLTLPGRESRWRDVGPPARGGSA